jgi:N-carbamoylputrescine amidase
MFNEHARRYGRSGTQVILAPRAAGEAALRRWLVALRMAAIVSGAYVLSSNRGGIDSNGQRFGGKGCIIDPEGDVVAETSEKNPVVFHEIETERVEKAQAAYPCYVRE